MSEEEKEGTIRRFANGSIKLLLATTVVEVRRRPGGNRPLGW